MKIALILLAVCATAIAYPVVEEEVPVRVVREAKPEPFLLGGLGGIGGFGGFGGFGGGGFHRFGGGFGGFGGGFHKFGGGYYPGYYPSWGHYPAWGGGGAFAKAGAFGFGR